MKTERFAELGEFIYKNGCTVLSSCLHEYMRLRERVDEAVLYESIAQIEELDSAFSQKLIIQEFNSGQMEYCEIGRWIDRERTVQLQLDYRNNPSAFRAIPAFQKENQ
jgi:hypothetical protein